jgi:Transposase
MSIRRLQGFAPRAAFSGYKEKTMAKRAEKRERRSMVLQPDAAGIDIGAEEIFVAVPPDRDEESTPRFSSFTRDLHALADWLGRCRIQTVAMESTGVYWIPLFQILEERGFKVYLVNAHYLKSVPGRKNDVSDCQWIQYLCHSYPVEAPRQPARDGSRAHSAHTERAQSDEPATPSCAQRHFRLMAWPLPGKTSQRWQDVVL